MGDIIELKLVRGQEEVGWLKLSYGDLEPSDKEKCYINIIESSHEICGEYEDWDYENALGQIRVILEKQDIKVACYAAWKFILYSGMSRDMGRAYIGYDMSGEGFSQKGQFCTFEQIGAELYSELMHFSEQRAFQEHMSDVRVAQVKKDQGVEIKKLSLFQKFLNSLRS